MIVKQNKCNNKAELMGKEKVPKVVLKLAIPTIVAMLVNAVYNAVDAMFISWLGVSQAGAISVAFPIFTLIIGIGLIFGTGASSYISRLLGENNKKHADHVASTAVFSTIFMALIFTITGIIFIDPIMKMGGASDTILPYARDYGRVIIMGCIFPILTRTLNNIMRSEGTVKINSIALIAGALLNILLDPILIFTFNMGIKGAAYATIISQSLTTIILGTYFISGKSLLTISPKYFRLSKKLYAEIIFIGLPTFLFSFLMSISLGLINKSVIIYGDSAIAALGIANRIFAISMYVVFGFAKGFQPIAGYNYGAKKFDRLKEAVVFSIKTTTIFTTIITLLIMFFSKPIMSIFSNDPLIQSIGIKALVGMHIAFPLFGIQMIIISLYLALGKGKEGGFLSMARQGIFFLPAIIILPKLFGITGVIYTQAVADLLTSFCAIILGLKLFNRFQLKWYNVIQ